jgi:hypothetical protein
MLLFQLILRVTESVYWLVSTDGCQGDMFPNNLLLDVEGKVHIYSDQKFHADPITLPLSPFRIDFISLLEGKFLLTVGNAGFSSSPNNVFYTYYFPVRIMEEFPG